MLSNLSNLLLSDLNDNTEWSNDVLGKCKLNIAIGCVWFTIENDKTITDEDFRRIDQATEFKILKDNKDLYILKHKIVANPVKVGVPDAGWKDIMVVCLD